jgi:hypothetical protein
VAATVAMPTAQKLQVTRSTVRAQEAARGIVCLLIQLHRVVQDLADQAVMAVTAAAQVVLHTVMHN